MRWKAASSGFCLEAGCCRDGDEGKVELRVRVIVKVEDTSKIDLAPPVAWLM